MGSNTSTSSTQSTVSKVNKDGIETHMMQDILLDPRSPDVNRTPLARILGNRVKPVKQTPSTPVNNLRKTLLNSSNEKKLLDPRSPSQFIPRTPLNMSLDENGIEDSVGQYSLEYSGCIEEASCRNFNERLANITFDNSYTETNNPPKVSENEVNNVTVSCAVLVDDYDKEQPLADSQLEPEKLCQNTLEVPKSRFDVNGENISPVMDTNQHNKRYAVSAFSSTPISTLTNNQQKSLPSKKLAKMTKEIFLDDEIYKDSQYATPMKRLMKIKEPRTPFGCLQNQQQLVLKELDNSTPKTKPTSISQRANKPRIIN